MLSPLARNKENYYQKNFADLLLRNGCSKTRFDNFHHLKGGRLASKRGVEIKDWREREREVFN